MNSDYSSNPVAGADPFDACDRDILDCLQRDSSLSNQALAKRVGLSASPCWRRVQRLQRSGVIDKQVALLDPPRLGLQVWAFAFVSLENHHPDSVRRFDEIVESRPEVLECFSMSGRNDYLLKVVCRSIAHYEHFLMHYLSNCPVVRSVNSSFVLRRKKYTTALPLD